MNPIHTIPSLSGTFGIRTGLALNPKIPKEPTSPSHSHPRIERQCIIEQIDNQKEHGQRTTAHIKNSYVCGSRNFVPCGKNTNGRHERSPEYRYFSYAQNVGCN